MLTGDQISCCGKRPGSAALCQNDRLNSYLDVLNTQGKRFDSAFVYKDELSAALKLENPKFVLLYQRKELIDSRNSGVPGLSGPPVKQSLTPQIVRRLLKLEWGQDGLSFSELDKKMPEKLLVRSKVFEPPIAPRELLRELEEVQMKPFDAEEWNSSSFCFHLISQAPGRDFDYR